MKGQHHPQLATMACVIIIFELVLIMLYAGYLFVAGGGIQ